MRDGGQQPVVRSLVRSSFIQSLGLQEVGISIFILQIKKTEAQRRSHLPEVTHSFGSGTKEDLDSEPGSTTWRSWASYLTSLSLNCLIYKDNIN